MLGESLERIEGIIDVSIIVPVLFENPLRELAVQFIADALSLKRKALIPTTSILGAYHIATRYLGVPRRGVKKILEGMLRTGSPILYPHVDIDLVVEALDIAVAYNIESWDGYLISLAKAVGTSIIFTLDMGLRRIGEIIPVAPFPENVVREYHEFVRQLVGKRKSLLGSL